MTKRIQQSSKRKRTESREQQGGALSETDDPHGSIIQKKVRWDDKSDRGEDLTEEEENHESTTMVQCRSILF